MTEAQFQAAIIDLARLLGYRVAHFRPAKTAHGWRTPVAADGVGYPDLTLARPGRLVFAEIKAAGGKLRPEQQAWLAVLAASGAEVYTWQVGTTSMQDIAETLQHQVGGQVDVG
jgi:VRR-NUC domain